MKILIVHDWAICRSGIKQILGDEFGPQDVTEGTPMQLRGHGILRRSAWVCEAVKGIRWLRR